MTATVEALSPLGYSSFLRRWRIAKLTKGTAFPLQSCRERAERRQSWIHPLEVSRGRKCVLFLPSDHQSNTTTKNKEHKHIDHLLLILLILTEAMIMVVKVTQTTAVPAPGVPDGHSSSFAFSYSVATVIDLLFIYRVLCSPSSPQTPYTAQCDPELLILLPLPPERWGYGSLMPGLYNAGDWI